MARRSKKFLICLVISIYICVLPANKTFAEALPEIMEGTSTVADIVMGYYAMSGNVVASETWVTTLYDSLGSSFGTIEELANQGYLIQNSAGQWEATQALETAIENTPAYTSLSLNEMFSVSSQEAAAAGGVAATGAGTLASATAGVGSIGVIPLAGAVTAAYWGGIALGTLIAHQLGLYGNAISQGSPIELNNLLETYSFPGGSFAGQMRVNKGAYSGYNQMYFVSAGTYPAYISSENACYVYTPSNVHGNWKRFMLSPSGSTDQNYSNTTNSGSALKLTDWSSGYVDLVRSNATYATKQDLVNAVSNNQYPQKTSPDMVGPNGNQIGSYDSETGGYTVPNMLPQIDPTREAGKPLTMQDWLDFVNGVKRNNGASDANQKNKELYDDMIGDMKVPNPSVDPNPDPNPDPDPYHPPVITPVPDHNYDVENETQPDWENETTAETDPVPPSIPSGKPWIVQGLQNKFPFCIPWDIKNMFSKLNSNSRQAPHISWRFNPPHTPVDYTFNLDLSDFEDAAALLRSLELIAFIVGLAYATRYLIGAT